MLNESEKVIDFGQKGVCWFRVLHCHGCCATYSWYAHLMAARSAKLVAQSVVFWYCFSSWLQPFNQSIRFVCLSSTNILKDNEPMISCSRRGGSYKSSNFLPMRNTWALWCWVDTSQPASEPEVINNMQVYWTFLFICSYLFCIMFYPIRSQFQLNLNCVKKDHCLSTMLCCHGDLSCSVLCNARSQAAEGILQPNSAHFSWLIVRLSSVRVGFCRSEILYFETD